MRNHQNLGRISPVENKEEFFTVFRMRGKSLGDFVDDFISVIISNWSNLSDKGVNPLNILGAGHYGCVFGTDDPDVVAKLTEDKGERLLFEICMKNALHGFVRVDEISTLHSSHGTLYYFIMKERVTPFHSLSVELKGLFFNLSKQLKKYANFILEGERLEGERILDDLSADIDFFYIGDSLRKLLSMGYVVCDLHHGNIGINTEEDRICIYDGSLRKLPTSPYSQSL